jgi:hypothetical protein
MAKTAQVKTQVQEASVADFLNSIPDQQKRNDCFIISGIIEQITKERPKMWGSSIVGFGSYHYKYASGREGDAPIIGFSPRKQNLTLYIPGGLETYQELMKKLGKYSTGKGCLYVKRLSDIDTNVLKELISESHKAGRSMDDASKGS